MFTLKTVSAAAAVHKPQQRAERCLDAASGSRAHLTCSRPESGALLCGGSCMFEMFHTSTRSLHTFNASHLNDDTCLETYDGCDINSNVRRFSNYFNWTVSTRWCQTHLVFSQLNPARLLHTVWLKKYINIDSSCFNEKHYWTESIMCF